MNMNRKTLKMTACCMAATVVLTGAPKAVFATETPVAGVTGVTSSALQDKSGNNGGASGETKPRGTTGAGISQQIASSMNSGESSASAESGTAGAGINQQIAASMATGENVAPAAEDAQPAETMIAGITQQISDSIFEADQKAEEQQKAEEARKAIYKDVAIAQVDNYVNVRDAATEEGEVVGKLYNNSAATVEAEENGWYKITSGNVTGYVKSEFVVCGDEELAKKVSRRVATVNTETLFVRTEPTTESDVLGMVPDQEQLTVTDESVDGWTKVAIEEGDGYVSNDYVKMSTEFVTAESKAEEEARLAKEEAERKAAEKAAKKSSAGSGVKASAGSSSGNAVANYACQFVGNPYVYGGTSLTNGADCSGFVMSVYAAFGVGLPHSSSALQGVGYGVSDMQPGDIICYSGHVGIYIGNNTIVHASTPEGGIKYTSPVNYRPIVAIRRIF
ncbi:MAG: SH3 domain-containing protein [Roseburia sp.]|nr:SH3 domain-containing protein [Roseburia sp.]